MSINCALVCVRSLASLYERSQKNECSDAESTGITSGPDTLSSGLSSTVPMKTVSESIEFLNTLNLQGEDVSDTGSSSQVQEVVTFIDNGIGDNTNIPMPLPQVALADGTAKTDLNAFLGRPTLIDSRTISTSATVGVVGTPIDPWFEFVNNAVISHKLQNYAFLRGKLCLKFIINGTPFHFGLFRAAYEPTVSTSAATTVASKIRSNTTSSLVYVTPYSQLPGVWIHPADNTGGELKVPFFNPRNWISLDVANNLRAMGKLTYYVAAPLAVASATASSTVTLDTYAWMEDVNLCGSTAQLILQGKNEYDGKISAPAATVAAAARQLSQIPFLYPFAKATDIGASAVAGIAALFGYTNVPNIDPVAAVVPTTAPHLATSEISVPFQKLSLDPKTELSVDPAMLGLPNEDEMVIANLVKRPSALTLLPWSTTNAAGDVLFNAQVTPTLRNVIDIVDTNTNVVAVRTYDTWMSYVSMLFANWRGDIVFDFEVVCTKFHKGRLKISWDPLQYTGTVVPDSNTVYTAILDVGEANKTSFTVPYHQALPWLLRNTAIQTEWSTGTTLPLFTTGFNGTLLLSVLTPLMSPITPQTVNIMVSVRAGDNFEFANPTDRIGTSFKIPSLLSVQGKDVVDIESTHEVLGDQSGSHPQRYLQNYGTANVSLRTLLHRMSLYDITTPFSQNFTRFGWWRKTFTRLPPSFGFQNNGNVNATKLLTSGTAPCIFPQTHPITYISCMYGGYRGSVNYVANIEQDLLPSVGHVRVSRIAGLTSPTWYRGAMVTTQNTATNSGNTTRFLSILPDQGNAGSAITNTMTNGSISWNLPDMNNWNFNYANPSDLMSNNVADGTPFQGCALNLLLKQTTGGASTELLTVTSYAGTGPDFNCLWALCCPTIDWYVSVPTVP